MKSTGICSSIVDLLGRIVKNDLKISALHSRRPDTVGEFVRSAELIARDLQSFSRDTPSLVKALELPSWSGGKPAWPPPRRSSSMAEMVMGSVPIDSGLEWFEQIEQRDLARRESYEKVRQQLGCFARGPEIVIHHDM